MVPRGDGSVQLPPAAIVATVGDTLDNQLPNAKEASSPLIWRTKVYLLMSWKLSIHYGKSAAACRSPMTSI